MGKSTEGEKTIQKFYDSLSSHYDEATRGKFCWTPPEEALALLLPRVNASMEVLDVGIGTGQSVENLIELGCKVVGVDLSEEMLKLTRAKFPELELHHADIEKDLAVLEGRFFDVVLAIGILEFVQDIRTTLESLASHLKNKGRFCFTFEELLPENEVQKHRNSPSSDSVDFLHYRHTIDEIKKFVVNLGLEWVEQKQFQAYLKSEKMIPVIYRIVLAQKP